MTILHTVGNIFESQYPAVAIPVNMVGVPGKGLALDAANRYPEWRDNYKEWCRNGQAQTGKLLFTRCNDGRVLISFPTKSHWRLSSSVELIEAGLVEMKRLTVAMQSRYGIDGVALPMLGCGEGKLPWDVVRGLIYKHFERHPLKIDLYGP